MSDEQWSEWIEHDGSDKDPIGVPEAAHQVRFLDGTESGTHINSHHWDWDHTITHYRYEIPRLSARPYDAYTTDELVHAVRNMREEIKRRSKTNLNDWVKFALEESKDFDYSGPYCGKM